MYRTDLKCPVCGKVLDTQHHPDREPLAMAVAMIGQDGRREHAKESPECTKDERWMRGWDKDGPHDLIQERVRAAFDAIPPGHEENRDRAFVLAERVKEIAKSEMVHWLGKHMEIVEKEKTPG